MEKEFFRNKYVRFALGTALFAVGVFFLSSLCLHAEEAAKTTAKYLIKFLNNG